MKQSAHISKRYNSPRDGWFLGDLLQIARKHWVVLVIAVAAGANVAMAFQWLYPHTYESKVHLLVAKKDPRLVARGIESGLSVSDVGVTDELIATHMQMIQSRVLVDSALKDEELSELPSIVEHLGNGQKPGDYVIANLSVSRGGFGQSRSAHVINISLRSRSKKDSELLLSAIIKKYQSSLSEKFQNVHRQAAFLIGRLQQELSADIEAVEKQYATFRQKSSNLVIGSPSKTANVHRVRYAEIHQELANLKLLRAESSARLEAINRRLSGGDFSELSDIEKRSFIDGENLTRVGLMLLTQHSESMSADFQSELARMLDHNHVENESHPTSPVKQRVLLADREDKHQEIGNAGKQVEPLDAVLERQKREHRDFSRNSALDLKALFEQYVELLKCDILVMDCREAQLKLLAEESEQLAREMASDEILEESLKRDVLRKHALFDAAVDRLREINLVMDYGGFANEMLAEPEPGLKIMPRMSVSLALGAALSLGICIAGIGIAEYRDRRFPTIAWLQGALQLPVIGRLPLYDERAANPLWFFKRQSGGAASSAALVRDSGSPTADAFRKLRALLVSTSKQRGQKILCLVSPNSGDGNSSVTANLAVSLGWLGRTVLVIDCDLRRPKQHEYFSVSNELGLTTIINDDLDPADSIQAMQYKNVWLIPSGPSVINPADFLATEKFSRLLSSLRERYDHILLDCPSVLTVPDVLAYASISDGAILVVRADSTTREDAQAACVSLKQVGAKLEGIIVNCLTRGQLAEESPADELGNQYS